MPTTDDGIIRAKGLFVTNYEGTVIESGADDDGNGLLMVKSKIGDESDVKDSRYRQQTE